MSLSSARLIVKALCAGQNGDGGSPFRQVLVLDFNEETNELTCDHSFSQPGEVWSVSPSPRDPSLLFTSHASPGKDGPAWFS